MNKDSENIHSARSQPLTPELKSIFDALYADYAAALDEARYDDWLGFFTDDCIYRVQSRENAERGLPLATLAFESLGMLKDRVKGITDTLIHQPYRQRHVLGPLRSLNTRDESEFTQLQLECAYAVFRVKHNALPEVFSVGRYRDLWRWDTDQWKLAKKEIIFDSDLIANSVIYPL
jgi:salicylate 5-hydroxylase small subunit